MSKILVRKSNSSKKERKNEYLSVSGGVEDDLGAAELGELLDGVLLARIDVVLGAQFQRQLLLIGVAGDRNN